MCHWCIAPIQLHFHRTSLHIIAEIHLWGLWTPLKTKNSSTRVPIKINFENFNILCMVNTFCPEWIGDDEIPGKFLVIHFLRMEFEPERGELGMLSQNFMYSWCHTWSMVQNHHMPNFCKACAHGVPVGPFMLSAWMMADLQCMHFVHSGILCFSGEESVDASSVNAAQGFSCILTLTWNSLLIIVYVIRKLLFTCSFCEINFYISSILMLHYRLMSFL